MSSSFSGRGIKISLLNINGSTGIIFLNIFAASLNAISPFVKATFNFFLKIIFVISLSSPDESFILSFFVWIYFIDSSIIFAYDEGFSLILFINSKTFLLYILSFNIDKFFSSSYPSINLSISSFLSSFILLL